MSKNVTSNKPLSGNQLTAVTVLLGGASIEVAAETVGVSERTIYRWMEELEFKQAMSRGIDQAIGNSIRSATRQLAELLDTSVSQLKELLEQPNLKPYERLRAIQVHLGAVARLHESMALEERVRALEEMLK